MIINLTKSNLFTEEPDMRFAREHSLPRGLWTELWKRYKLYEFTIPELCEYYTMKTGRKTSNKAISRWIWRSEIYSLAHPAIKKGAEVVISSFFNQYEWQVIRELTKNVKSSVHQNPKTLV